MPVLLKTNWIEASSKPQSSLDSFLHAPDNENIDTSRYLYSYFRHKKRAHFLLLRLTKEFVVEPGIRTQ